MFIWSYKFPSKGAKSLAGSLKAKRIRDENSKFKGLPHKMVINWGASEVPPEVMKCAIINPPDKVSDASNKLIAFQMMERDEAEINIPPFTEDIEEAKAWTNDGHVAVCRTTLRGHSGEGIVIAETPDEVVAAPLYTQYIKKAEEYRIHVVKGKVIDRHRKARRLTEENVNWRVRNHANGFIFQRNDIDIPKGVEEQALLTVAALGLDFGAVDLIYNAKQGIAYVLEVNTAPGLEGSTVESYSRAFKELEEVDV